MTLHGFAQHSSSRGFRAKCVHGCPWRGPWRGLALSVVETDAVEHEQVCGSRPKTAGQRGSLTAQTSGAGDCVNSPGSVADTTGGADNAAG